MINYLNKLKYFVVALFVTFSFNCLAQETEVPKLYEGKVTVLTGVSKYQKQGDGIWYQEAFPYELKLNTNSVGIRYDTKPKDNVSYGFGYMKLGGVSSYAKATAKDNTSPGDDGYSPDLKGCDGTCWPLSTWYGKGDVQGIFGAAKYHSGPWAVEAGVYAYKPSWNMKIPDYISCRDCQPVYLEVNHKEDIQLGPMLGLSYTKEPWSLHLSTWRVNVNGDEWIPLWTGWTTNLSLGYSF